MTVYLDASVVLRVIFGAKNQLPEWKSITRPISSRLLTLECMRTFDRMRFTRQEDVAELVNHREAFFQLLGRIEILPLSDETLDQAAQALPSPLATLDSIHLASALLWQQSEGESLSFATHDGELSQAARAMGFKVLG